MGQRIGLSTEEHLRAAGLLRRVTAGLKGISVMLHHRYLGTHPVQRECNATRADVQALRLELENAARGEHPAAKIIYLADDQPNADAMSHALASGGDGVGEID